MIILASISINNISPVMESKISLVNYIKGLKEKKMIILLKKITEILSEATLESMREIKVKEYILFTQELKLEEGLKLEERLKLEEESKSEENKKNFESSLQYYFGKVNTFTTEIISNPFSVFKNTMEKETKIDLLELSKKIKDRINQELHLFYSILNWKSTENFHLVELTTEQTLNIFSQCLKDISIQNVFDNILNIILSKTLKDQLSNKDEFLFLDQKDNLIVEIQNTLKLLGRNINILHIVNGIMKEVLETKKYQNEQIEKKIKISLQSIKSVTKIFIILLKNFFFLSDEDAKKKVVNMQSSTRYGEKFKLTNSMETILQLANKNIAALNNIFSSIKKVIKLDGDNIKLQIDEIVFLKKLSKKSEIEIRESMSNLSIKIRLYNMDAEDKKTLYSTNETYTSEKLVKKMKRIGEI